MNEELLNGSTFLYPIGLRRVFMTTLVLTILDLLYIYFFLPESNSKSGWSSPSRKMLFPTGQTFQTYGEDGDDEEEDNFDADSSVVSYESHSTVGKMAQFSIRENSKCVGSS